MLEILIVLNIEHVNLSLTTLIHYRLDNSKTANHTSSKFVSTSSVNTLL